MTETKDETKDAQPVGLREQTKDWFRPPKQPAPWQQDRIDGLLAAIGVLTRMVAVAVGLGFVVLGAFLMSPATFEAVWRREALGAALVLLGVGLAWFTLVQDEKAKDRAEDREAWRELREREAGRRED